MNGVSLRPAVFLDRDGVLVVPEFRDGRSYAPRALEQFAIYPDAHAALSKLDAAGFVLVVVTNQPDLGHGRVLSTVVEKMHARLLDELPIHGIEMCPHRQNDACECRKPKPGMLLRAASDYGLDLNRSFMVGDRASDVEAGAQAGCSTIFIDLHYTADPRPIRPDHVARDVSDAADIILRSYDCGGQA